MAPQRQVLIAMLLAVAVVWLSGGNKNAQIKALIAGTNPAKKTTTPVATTPPAVFGGGSSTGGAGGSGSF